MASQTDKPQGGPPAKTPSSKQQKKGIKNPWIYAGTVILLAFVVIAFIFVPAGGSALSGGGGSLVFGSYAGKNLAYTQNGYFALQVQNLNDSLRQSGLSEESYQFYAYQVWRGAFERTVVRYGIMDAMKRAGATVTDTKVDEKITELPQYQEDGKFSIQLYRAATQGKKLELRRDIREDILAQAFYADAVLGQEPSSKELDFVKDMAKDTRTIEYVALPLSTYPDSEVGTWAAANAAQFKRLTLSRITLGEDENAALKLLKSVQDKSAVFEDAAKLNSKDSFAEKGGAQGGQYYYEVEADLAKKEDAEKLAALAVGELSPVLKTVSGSYAFFRADVAPVDADLSNPSVIADIRERMLSTDRGTIEDYVIEKAATFAANGAADFAKAAKKEGLAIKTAGPFPINYGDLSLYIADYGQSLPLLTAVANEDTPELASASYNEKFLSAAFSLAPGSVSEPLVLGDNVIVFKVKEAASALDDSSGGIDVFYPYFIQNKAESDARQAFLKSPLLKDNFSAVYLKYFTPSKD